MNKKKKSWYTILFVYAGILGFLLPILLNSFSPTAARVYDFVSFWLFIFAALCLVVYELYKKKKG